MISPPLERIDLNAPPKWYLKGVVAEHRKRYEFIATSVQGLRVLDSACGSGYGSAILAAKAKEVVGVDICPQAVAEAAAAYGSPTVQFTCADARKLPFEANRFDVAASFETIEHLPSESIEDYLKELQRVVVPGGSIFISTPEKDSYSLGGPTGNPFHTREFCRREFLDCLGRYFGVHTVYGQEFSPRWQVNLARALARGTLFAPMSRAWRAYKMVVDWSGEVLPADSRPRHVPLVMLVEAANRK